MASVFFFRAEKPSQPGSAASCTGRCFFVTLWAVRDKDVPDQNNAYMTLLDILIVVLAISGAFVGWRKGLTGQLGAVAGVLVAIILCRWFGRDLAGAFSEPDDTPSTVMLHTVLAYVVLAVGAYVGVRVIARFVGSITKALNLSFVNRAAGAVFGVFEWMLGLSLMLNLWVGVFPDTELRTSNNAMVEGIRDLGPAVMGSETVKDIFAIKDMERPEALGGSQEDDAAAEPRPRQ